MENEKIRCPRCNRRVNTLKDGVLVKHNSGTVIGFTSLTCGFSGYHLGDDKHLVSVREIQRMP